MCLVGFDVVSLIINTKSRRFGKGNCRKENVNYEIECVRSDGDYIYVGETARNAYCRGREHLKGIKCKDRESVFVEHVTCLHNSDFDYDACSGFKMNVCETHKSALNRVVTEAVKIEKCSRPTLNRKTGYRANSVLRLTSSLTSERNSQPML